MKLLRAVAVAAALLVGVSASQAGFKMKFKSGSTTTDEVDLGYLITQGSGASYVESSLGAYAWNYTGFSYNSTTNSLTLGSLSAFGYTIEAVYAKSNSPLGNPALLSLVNVNITKTSAASNDPFSILITSTGYTKPEDVVRVMRTKATGFDDNTASFTSIYDTYPVGGREYGGSDAWTTSRTVTSPTGSKGVYTNLPGGTPNFSLTNIITITDLGTGDTFNSTSLETLIEEAPAPPALVLVALGVPALGLARRFTRKTAVVA